MEKRLLWYTSTANRHEIYVNLLSRMINRDLLKSGFSITDHFFLETAQPPRKGKGAASEGWRERSVEAEIEKNMSQTNIHTKII